MSHSHHVHMDTVAGCYDSSIPSHVQQHYLDKRSALIRSLLARGVVVDVGCGTGTLAGLLRAGGLTVVGVDESLGMLQQAQRARPGPYLCGDSIQLPLAANSVDGVFCVATLHHVRDPEQVKRTLAEMARIVKPGGWALVWDHNPLNPYWPYFMKRLPQDQEPTRLVPLRELVAGLAGCGMNPVRTFRSGLVPDFAPRSLLWFFRAVEWFVERVPGLNLFCAHNVVIGTKPPAR